MEGRADRIYHWKNYLGRCKTVNTFVTTSCKFCNKSIPLKSICNPDTGIRRVDLEDQSLQISLHFIKSPGCEVLHDIMDRGVK